MKLGYVGSVYGDLSVMVTPREAVVSLDLSVPSLSPFMVRMPLSTLDGDPDAFQNMMGAVLVQATEYLKACKASPDLVEAFRKSALKAMEGVSEKDHADNAGGESSSLLRSIPILEPVDSYEVEFPLPEELVPVLHQRVVNASAKRSTVLAAAVHRSPSPVKLPPGFRDNPKSVVQNPTAIRNIIRKTRGQQNKPVVGPVYVLIYDLNGRPVGVRSIKGPGWKGISGKIASSGLSGWILPDGAFLSGSSFEDLAQTYLSRGLPEDSSEDDARAVAQERGWIHLWVMPEHALAVEMGGITQTKHDLLKGFLGQHPEWVQERVCLIVPEGGHLEMDLPAFLACDRIENLGRAAVMSSWKGVLARSYMPEDVPNTFWAVIDIGYEPKPRVAQDLIQGELHGVHGISDDSAIVAQFAFHSGNAILRMPGQETLRLNALSRVNYGNPNYLCSKGMSALFRVLNQEQRSGGAHNVLSSVLSRFPNENANFTYYQTAISNSIRGAFALTSSVNSPQDLAVVLQGVINRFFAEKFEQDVPNYDLEKIKAWTLHALERIGQLYSDEGEWVLKDHTLRIPQGSTLVLDLSPDIQRVMDAVNRGDDPELAFPFEFKDNLVRAEAKGRFLQELIRGLTEKGRIKVVVKNWMNRFQNQRSTILEKKRQRRENP